MNDRLIAGIKKKRQFYLHPLLILLSLAGGVGICPSIKRVRTGDNLDSVIDLHMVTCQDERPFTLTFTLMVNYERQQVYKV